MVDFKRNQKRTLSFLTVFFITLVLQSPAIAELNQGQNLNNRGQSKVSRALAKGYSKGGEEGNAMKQPQVNIGSRRNGDCTMNVGTQGASDKNSKEVIITSKDIINVCK